MKPPARLYKFRPFNDHVLDMLLFDRLFYSDPSTFNDPLDTKPSLKCDISTEELERVLGTLVEQRTRAELMAAAKTIKYSGPKTLDHIELQSRKRSQRVIEDIRYHATNPEYGSADPEQFLLAHSIEEELLRRFDKGIVSFATRDVCPLMWSHYGDQHKGICVGYSVRDEAQQSLYKVKYGHARAVTARDVEAMLSGNDAARRRVDEAVFVRKAAAWRYEHEWRLIGHRGLQDSPLELEEVVFGLRCSDTVKFTVVSALAKRTRPLSLFEVFHQNGSFELRKRELETTDFGTYFPRRVHDAMEAFSEIVLPADA
ncbi:MAG: DUF2971 domain-containing protein [Hyphomicrobiaceae bacterium]